jgi:replicative DNA helicase
MINTGFYELDRLIGNIIGGQYIILAGRPSMGKTAFALNIARNLARKNKAVAIFSAEQSKSELLLRLIAQNSNLTMEQVFNGQTEIELANNINNIYDLPIFIDDSANISPISIKSSVSNLLKRKININLVIIDYLQLIKSNNKYNSRYEEISAISREIKNISRDLNIPFIVLAQLNRKLEDREDKRPKLSDLRDSGNIEQDADKVLFIYRDEVYNDNTDFPHTAEILIKKNRNGRLGSVQLYFNQEHINFYSLEKEENNA